MTEQEFWDAFRQRWKMYGFRLNELGFVRENHTGACPIIGTAQEITDEEYCNARYHYVGTQILGLPGEFVVKIAISADHYVSADPEIRTRLLNPEPTQEE